MVLLTPLKIDERAIGAILFCLLRLRLLKSFQIVQRMAETLERVAAPKPSTPRSVFIFRFASTLVLWSIALGIIFSGYELAFFALIGTLGLLSLWEFYGMLDHKGLPNFKITAMICGAVMLCGSFYYFSKIGPGHSYDFEMAVLLFFLLTVFARQMFSGLRDDAPLRTMAYTIFGLLYVLWLYNFITKIVYVVPRSPAGAVTGQFYVLYLVAITKFSDMGAYLTGSLIGRHQLIPHISPKKTWEGFFGALALGDVQADARSSFGAELDPRDGAGFAAGVRRGHRRSRGVDH
jgi:phosphatidate cytidylyltransferase